MEFNDKPTIGTLWIIIAAVLFFPVSILLLLIRIVMHWNLSFQRIGDTRAAGYISMITFAVLTCFIYLVNANEMTTGEYVIIAFFFGALFLSPAGIFLTLARRKSKQLDTRYAFYEEIIVERNETSIAAIAEITNRRHKMVANDVLRMIYIGYLDDGYIDESSDCIVFYDASDSEEEEYIDEDEEQEEGNQIKLFPKKVECAGCGSSSTLKPREAIFCTYCGASLVYPA